MDRITYKSNFGDYGSVKDYTYQWTEIFVLRNALGKYEDLGYTPEELEEIVKELKEKDRRNENV